MSINEATIVSIQCLSLGPMLSVKIATRPLQEGENPLHLLALQTNLLVETLRKTNEDWQKRYNSLMRDIGILRPQIASLKRDKEFFKQQAHSMQQAQISNQPANTQMGSIQQGQAQIALLQNQTQIAVLQGRVIEVLQEKYAAARDNMFQTHELKQTIAVLVAKNETLQKQNEELLARQLQTQRSPSIVEMDQALLRNSPLFQQGATPVPVAPPAPTRWIASPLAISEATQTD